MDLSQFQLLKEDANNYHVGHPSGKALVVSKAGLSDKAQKAIERLKGQPQKMAGGGPVDPTANLVADASEMPTSTPVTPDAYASTDPGYVAPGNQGVDFKSFFGFDAPKGKGPSAPTAEDLNKYGSVDAAIAAETARNPMPAATVASAGPTQIPAGSAQTISSVTPPDAPTPSIGTDDPWKAAETATLAKGVAEGNQSLAMANAAKANLKAYQDAPTDKQEFDRLSVGDQKFQEAFANQSIDPNRFWKNQDTGSKITAGIGLILSGAGAGVTGQPNLAAKFIDDAINRDIDAQKNEQGKAMNLWKMNREMIGSDIAATAAAKAQALAPIAAQIQMAMNQNAPEIQKQNALIALNTIKQEQAKLNAVQTTAKGLGLQIGSGTEQEWMQRHAAASANPATKDLAKEFDDKLVPGIGVASVKLQPDDRQELTNYGTLEKYLNEAIAFQTTGPGANVGAWSPANRKQAATIQANIVNSLNQAIDSKRPPSPEAAAQWKKVVGNPGSFDLFGGNAAGLKQMLGDIHTRKQTLTSSLGVTPFREAPQVSQAKLWLQQNPTAPEATAVAARLRQMGITL